MAERLPDEWASALPSPGMVTQPPQRQLRQKLGCAYHPEGRLFIYIDNCGVFCWNGRFRAVRHPYGFKGGCCAEEVVYLHGGPFSVKAAVQVLFRTEKKKQNTNVFCFFLVRVVIQHFLKTIVVQFVFKVIG